MREERAVFYSLKKVICTKIEGYILKIDLFLKPYTSKSIYEQIGFYLIFMRARFHHGKVRKRFQPEAIEKLEFLDCLNLIRELQLLGAAELKSKESIEIIKKLESRIKYLGSNESYKCMAALPAVNALVR
jgi:hypothetical protein